MKDGCNGYYSSEEKDVVRTHFDLPLVRRVHKSKRRRLGYFGLPGSEALDLQEWGGMLKRAVAVEKDTVSREGLQETLRSRLPRLRCDVIEGEMDEIIISGRGEDKFSGGRRYSSDIRSWDFDIVYLDYFGPFLPSVRSGLEDEDKARTKALHALFDSGRVDAWEEWLLLLTVDTRLSPEMRDEMRRFLVKAKSGFSREVRESLDYMLSGPSGSLEERARLILGSYAVLMSAAVGAQSRAKPRGAVLYKGSEGHDMIHLACEFFPNRDALGSVSSPGPFLEVPVLSPLVSGEPWLEMKVEQSPQVTTNVVKGCLEFLEKEEVDLIVSRWRSLL